MDIDDISILSNINIDKGDFDPPLTRKFLYVIYSMINMEA